MNEPDVQCTVIVIDDTKVMVEKEGVGVHEDEGSQDDFVDD